MNEKSGVGKVVMKGLNEKGGEEKRKGICQEKRGSEKNKAE